MLYSRDIVKKKLGNKTDAQRDEISRNMVKRCDGMFLWMRMLKNQLRGGMNARRLKEIIDETPAGIDRLYDRNWNRISSRPEYESKRARSILRWAAFSLRPLTVLELTEALLVDDDEDDGDGDLSVNELPDAIDHDYVRGEIVGLCEALLETRSTVG